MIFHDIKSGHYSRASSRPTNYIFIYNNEFIIEQESFSVPLAIPREIVVKSWQIAQLSTGIGGILGRSGSYPLLATH
jgi:hypothetical protein